MVSGRRTRGLHYGLGPPWSPRFPRRRSRAGLHSERHRVVSPPWMPPDGPYVSQKGWLLDPSRSTRWCQPWCAGRRRPIPHLSFRGATTVNSVSRRSGNHDIREVGDEPQPTTGNLGRDAVLVEKILEFG
jgi:hypothetical protein